MRTAAGHRTFAAIVAVTSLAAAAMSIVVAAPPARAQTPGVYWGLASTASLPRLGPAPPGEALDLLLGLPRDLPGLEALATAVSDPRSASYGSYDSVPELVARYGASPAEQAALVAALADVGATASVDVSAGFATATVTVAQAEALFGSPMGLYDVPATPLDAIAPDDPTALALPPSLVGVVDVVLGLDKAIDVGPAPPPPPGPPATTYAPAAGGTPIRTGTMAGCAEATGITYPGALFGLPGNAAVGLGPDQLRTAYGFDALAAGGLTGAGTRVALVETGPFDPADLAAYRACFGISGVAPQVHGSAGATISDEATLDVEVLAAAAPGVDRLDVFLTTNPYWGPLLSGPLDLTATGGTRTDVVSVSYGQCEHSADVGDVAVAEFVLALAAAAGITYVVSAGDSGSSGCVHEGSSFTGASASYPATSWWVTAVGGTNLTLDLANRRLSEGVWNDLAYAQPPGSGDPARDGAGGGGPSQFPYAPPWQHGPGVPPAGSRLTPDVALFADSLPGYAVRCSCPATGLQLWDAIGGTSAATPLFAGMMAVMIQAARLQGQADPGLVAPLLYELARTTGGGAPFHDVTLGTNDQFNVGCCAATPGYDQASGWGSLDALALAASLAAPLVDLKATTPGTPVDGPRQVELTASVLANGTVLDYHWDLNGDGTIDRVTAGPTTTVTVEAPGLAAVAVAARSSLGRIGADVILAVIPGALEAPDVEDAPAAQPVEAEPRYTG